MNFLGLDMGSRMGYAILEEDRIRSGTRKLLNKSFGQRFSDFRSWLITTVLRDKIGTVFFERVYRHLGTEAAHVYGGLMYTLASVCEELGIPYYGFGVGAIKKFMTGKGNASKAEMVQAAEARGFCPQDDNAADAIAVLLFGIKSTSVFPDGHTKRDRYSIAKECSGSFQPLGESGFQPPDKSLASDAFQRVTGVIFEAGARSAG